MFATHGRYFRWRPLPIIAYGCGEEAFSTWCSPLTKNKIWDWKLRPLINVTFGLPTK